MNILGLYISFCKQEAGHRLKTTTTTDRIPELPTDRHFLELSETCLYMLHFGVPNILDISSTLDYLPKIVIQTNE